MGIDLLTGKHICFGLSIGEGCQSCREKYPHLLAKTPEEIEAGKQNLQAAIAAYTDDRNGEHPRTREELNSFAYRRPAAVVQDNTDEQAPPQKKRFARLRGWFS